MLQSMGLQRIRHKLATEQQQQDEILCFSHQASSTDAASHSLHVNKIVKPDKTLSCSQGRCKAIGLTAADTLLGPSSKPTPTLEPAEHFARASLTRIWPCFWVTVLKLLVFVFTSHLERLKFQKCVSIYIEFNRLPYFEKFILNVKLLMELPFLVVLTSTAC